MSKEQQHNRAYLFIHTHPITTYFGIVFLISYGGFLVTMAPKLLEGKHIQPLDALLLFPVMEVGVCLAGVVLTRIIDGKIGFKRLISLMRTWHVKKRWYAILLIPPFLILSVLLILHAIVTSSFAPKFFPLGITFGVIAGFFEEIGWTGFVYPKMRQRYNALIASIILGVLWGLWHAPVVDYLGVAAPHGSYWLPFFLSFIAMLTALRVLIVWIYANTKSVLLTQLMHASNTGFLVMLSPSLLSPAQETLWYAVYAVALWFMVILIVSFYGKQLIKQ